MKHTFIVGNWKSYKTVKEAEEWFGELATIPLLNSNTTVVLCPPFPLLALCQSLIAKYHLPLHLGAQTVSSLGEGKYTGEVDAVMLKDFVEYVLIGHSERRKYDHETDEDLSKKVKEVLTTGLTPVYFVQGKETPVPENVPIVAYEPVFAIGTGNPDTPEDAENVASFFKQEKHIPTVLYGGSTNDTNVAAFMSCSSIDGIVPGAASLDAKEFAKIINNA